MTGPGPRKEIEDYINKELPTSFSSDEIREMYDKLVKDVSLLKKEKGPGMTDAKIGMLLQQKNKKMAFAYPSIYFKTIKGEMKPEMLDSLLRFKKKLDTKEISLDEARMKVIDGAKEDIRKNPKESRPQRSKGDVQEMTVLCKTPKKP